MASLLAILSSLMWGTSDFLGGVTSRRLPALAVYGLSQAVGFVVLVAVATVVGGWSADPGYWPWAIGSSVLGMIGMLAFYQALSIGPMGIVSPLVALSVLVPVAVSLLRGELPAAIQVLGIILAISGILLASGPELSGAETAKPLILAGVAALAFGGMFVLMAEGSKVRPAHDDDRHAGDDRGHLRRDPAGGSQPRRCATGGRPARSRRSVSSTRPRTSPSATPPRWACCPPLPCSATCTPW